MDQIDLVFLDISGTFPLASVSAELPKNNRFFVVVFTFQQAGFKFINIPNEINNE